MPEQEGGGTGVGRAGRGFRSARDGREIRRAIAALPEDNAFRALDEVIGWLESLPTLADVAPDRLFEWVCLLDEAGRPHVGRLARNYLLTPRLSRAEEKNLWGLIHGFWSQLALGYERCLSLSETWGRTGEALKGGLPLLCLRLVAALGAEMKWKQFHYGPVAPTLWSRLGRALLSAEAVGAARIPQAQLPGQPATSSVEREFVRVLVFHVASMESLLPLEIELADRLIARFVDHFVFSAEPLPNSVCWLDLALAQPPVRLLRLPAAISPTLRFFQPGRAAAGMAALAAEIDAGRGLPPELDLGGSQPVGVLSAVLAHLGSHLSPRPPQRRFDRHRVKHRMSVLHGLVNALVVFSGDFGGRPAGLPMESWVVENVSRGGFGASLNAIPADWLKVGVLVALQPEGGENWLLGVVRRYWREAEDSARVGIETLARQVAAVELRPRMASSYGAAATVPALWLRDGESGDEIQLLLPPAVFAPGEGLEMEHGGEVRRLEPAAFSERNADYQVARYRLAAG